MRFRALISGILAVLVLACSAQIPTLQPMATVQPPLEENRSLGRDGASWANVKLQGLWGSWQVRPQAQDALVQGYFRYNVAEWKPEVSQSTKDGDTQATLRQGLGLQIPGGGSDVYTNVWNVALATGMPMNLAMDLGSGEATVDASGLSLSGLSFNGADTDLRLSFSSVNPEPLTTLRVVAGAGDTILSGLGNANLDRLSVTGGAGLIDVDFNGAWSRGALADITAGAGKITIRVPQGLGVRVVLIGAPVRAVKTSGFVERGQDAYVNSSYGVAPLTLTIHLTVGVGDIVLISQ